MTLTLEEIKKFIPDCENVKESMLQKNINFYNRCAPIRINWKSYEQELVRILKSDNAFRTLKETKIPTFNFELPEIDYNKIREEAYNIINKKENWKYMSTVGYPNFLKWRIYFLYGEKGKALKTNTYDFDVNNLNYIHADAPEINKFIQNWGIKTTQAWLSELDPGGAIWLHTDRGKKSGPGKTRLNIETNKACEFIVEEAGILPYPNNSVVMLDNTVPHAVYNFSNIPKVDMQIAIDVKSEEQIFKANKVIKKRIEELLT